MTTMILLTMVMMMLVCLMSKVKNPVKLSVMLMVLSSMLFLKMYVFSNQVWFPILFFLIFMGGILIMFMILSSVLPNESSSKNKKLIYFIPLSIICAESSLKSNFSYEIPKMVKSIFDSSSTISTMMMIMMMYFFYVILMVSKEETPMRKSIC